MSTIYDSILRKLRRREEGFARDYHLTAEKMYLEAGAVCELGSGDRPPARELVVCSGGVLRGVFGATVDNLSAEAGAVVDLAYGTTPGDDGKPANSGLTLRGSKTAFAEGTLYCNGAPLAGSASGGVISGLSGYYPWRFCVGSGITVSGGTLTSGARVYAHEDAVISGALVLESGNIGLADSGTVGRGITLGGPGCEYGNAYLQVKGSAYDTVVLEGGRLNASSYTSGVTVSSGGYVFAANGGVIVNAAVHSGGLIALTDNIVLSNITVYSGGRVSANSSLANCAISQLVLSGGTLHDSQRLATLYGGTVEGLYMTGAGDALFEKVTISGGSAVGVPNGAAANSAYVKLMSCTVNDYTLSAFTDNNNTEWWWFKTRSVASGLVLRGHGARANFDAGCRVDGAQAWEDSWLVVAGSGTAITVDNFARLTVTAGGRVSGVSVGIAGSLYVSSGGSALAVTSGLGADITVAPGGYAEIINK